jgi:Ca-activated chloride channel family protein
VPRARVAQAAAASVLAALLLLPARARGADDAAPPDPAASLSKVVGRLSAQDQCSAVDWAEMSSETLSWGQHLGAGGQPVPEPPVRDALAAVDQGSRLDPKAADWPRLKSELEKLLQKPDPKDQQQQQQKQDQKKDQDKKEDQQKDQQQQGQNQDQKQDQKQGQNQQQPQNQQQNQSGNPSDSKDQRDQQQNPQSGHPRDQKAFGDMSKPQGSPAKEKPSQGATQKVGGVTKEQQNDPAMKNPELAVSLEKLEQVKNEDSPAELFGLMRRGEPEPPSQDTGKKW